MRDLIFVVRNDGTYQKVPIKKLRGQENYSDNFVVIANRVGIVKANIRLLGRTDKVITQFLVPTFEKVEDFIGNKPYFQDYVEANVWRIAVSKTALRDISQSYSGHIEVSFSFLTLVDDERATNPIGDLTDDLPGSANEGDYLVCKLSTFTKNDTTWTYGQLAIYHNGEWIKGGRYRVEGNTTTHKMSVEPTLIGTLPEDEIEDEEALRMSLEELAAEVDTKANESDLQSIVDGNTVVGKADADGSGRVIDKTYIETVQISYDPTIRKVQITTNTPFGIFKYSDLTLPEATTLLSGLMSASDKARLDNTYSKDETYSTEQADGLLLLKEDKAKKGVSGGYAPLDENAKLPLLYLYDSILGQIEYAGTFDGATVPTRTQSITPERDVRRGDYFISTGSGLIDGIDFEDGDWMVFDSPTTWQKIDNTDAISLINGKKGVVVLTGEDIDVSTSDNTKLSAKLSTIDSILLDTYRKVDVYTKVETQGLIDQLKAIHGWESSYLGDLVSLSAIGIDGYDFAYIQAYTTDGKIDATPVELKQLDSNKTINVCVGVTVLYDHALKEFQVADYTGYNAIKIIGYKVEQQKAENIAYNETNNVANVIDTEVREIGEEVITYLNGKVVEVESDTLLTEVFYDINGNVEEVHETYKVDNKKYKTTFEKDGSGRVNKVTKGVM